MPLRQRPALRQGHHSGRAAARAAGETEGPPDAGRRRPTARGRRMRGSGRLPADRAVAACLVGYLRPADGLATVDGPTAGPQALRQTAGQPPRPPGRRAAGRGAGDAHDAHRPRVVAPPTAGDGTRPTAPPAAWPPRRRPANIGHAAFAGDTGRHGRSGPSSGSSLSGAARRHTAATVQTGHKDERDDGRRGRPAAEGAAESWQTPRTGRARSAARRPGATWP